MHTITNNYRDAQILNLGSAGERVNLYLALDGDFEGTGSSSAMNNDPLGVR
jgi:hypothetical protein